MSRPYVGSGGTVQVTVRGGGEPIIFAGDDLFYEVQDRVLNILRWEPGKGAATAREIASFAPDVWEMVTLAPATGKETVNG